MDEYGYILTYEKFRYLTIPSFIYFKSPFVGNGFMYEKVALLPFMHIIHLIISQRFSICNTCYEIIPLWSGNSDEKTAERSVRRFWMGSALGQGQTVSGICDNLSTVDTGGYIFFIWDCSGKHIFKRDPMSG